MSTAALLAHELVKSFADRRVLDGVSLTVAPGRRVGLVGENGVGKSTLLRVLGGLDDPDSGEVSRPADVGFLHQELPAGWDLTLDEVIADALAEVRAVERDLAALTEVLARHPDDPVALENYGRGLEWARVHEVWNADHRADVALDGLGLGGIGGDRTLGTLSGGERSRLGLAALLVRQPAALLLDEPTNHLDVAAVAFVERHLAALPGVVVLASHDRAFLDAVCTDIIDLDPSLGGPTRYGGGFSDYLGTKRAERARWQQRHTAEQEELKALREAVSVTARQVGRGAPRGNTSKLAYDFTGSRVQKQISRRVRNARQRLDELTRDQVAAPPKPLRFTAPVTGAPTADDAAADDVIVRVRDTAVADRLWIDELDLAGDGRLLVTGPNGAGKSTLLLLLAGSLTARTGFVQRKPGVRVGLLEQDAVFSDPTRTPRRIYLEAIAGRGNVPALTELGLIAPRDVDRPVGALSVGQRRRVALAALIAAPPHVLLLDEPTNHLSLTLAGELEDALHSAPGAIVVASHDRWLRHRWRHPVLTLENGRITSPAPAPAMDEPAPAKDKPAFAKDEPAPAKDKGVLP